MRTLTIEDTMNKMPLLTATSIRNLQSPAHYFHRNRQPPPSRIQGVTQDHMVSRRTVLLKNIHKRATVQLNPRICSTTTYQHNGPLLSYYVFDASPPKSKHSPSPRPSHDHKLTIGHYLDTIIHLTDLPSNQPRHNWRRQCNH
jgi:hypothetical protein